MQSLRRPWIVLLAVCAIATCLGCKNGDTEPEGNGDEPGNRADTDPANGGAVKPPADEPPPKPTFPKAAMTAAEREKCLIWLEDKLPEAELTDVAGATQQIAALRGEKLTVVCFFNVGDSLRSQMKAEETLDFLQNDFHIPFEAKGVRVVAVNVGDSGEVVRDKASQAEVAFPLLMDADGAYFASVAKDGLPRVYLLDADGKVVWLDYQFSQTTNDTMKQGIQIVLGEI